MVERRILRIAIVALCCLAIYGIFSERILSQQIWEGNGGRRLLFLSGVYSVAAAVFHAMRPGWFVPFGLLAAAFCAVSGVGFAAPAAVVFFLTSSGLVGDAILRSRDWVLATLLGLSVYVTLFNFIAPLRIHIPATHLLILGIPLLVFRERSRQLPGQALAALRAASSLRGGNYFGMAFAGFMLFVHLLVAMKPEVSADGLAMHLAIPAFVHTRHEWTFDVKNYIYAVMPMNGDWAFTIAYLLGGEYSARLLNFAVMALIVALVFDAARHWLSTGVASLAAGALAATPLVQTVTGSLMVENIWSAMIVGAVIAIDRYRTSGRIQYLTAATILAGAALASKFGALSFLIPMVAYLAAALIRRPLRPLTGFALMAVFLMCAAPPYVNAYARTRNPVFPFMNAVFKSPRYPLESARDPRFREKLKGSTLYDLTFRSHRFFEGQNGAFGFQYFLLLPLCLVLIRRDPPFIFHAVLGVGVAGSALVFLSTPNLRYIYPALPLLTIAICPLLARFPAAIAATAIAGGLNLYCLGTSGWYHKDFVLNLPFKPVEAQDYVRFHAPDRRLIELLNAADVRTPVAFMEGNRIAGLQAQALSNSWHCDWFTRALASAHSAEAVLQLAEENKIHYFIAPRAMPAGVLREFLDRYTTPIAEFGRSYAAKLTRK